MEGRISGDSTLFTGGSDENRKTFEIEKDDASSSLATRKMLKGSVTIDFNSTSELFTDKSVIKNMITVSAVASQVRNLKRTVHICHNGVPLLHGRPTLEFQKLQQPKEVPDSQLFRSLDSIPFITHFYSFTPPSSSSAAL